LLGEQRLEKAGGDEMGMNVDGHDAVILLVLASDLYHVMPGLDPGITKLPRHMLYRLYMHKHVDGRVKPGHDDE